MDDDMYKYKIQDIFCNKGFRVIMVSWAGSQNRLMISPFLSGEILLPEILRCTFFIIFTYVKKV